MNFTFDWKSFLPVAISKVKYTKYIGSLGSAQELTHSTDPPQPQARFWGKGWKGKGKGLGQNRSNPSV